MASKNLAINKQITMLKYCFIIYKRSPMKKSVIAISLMALANMSFANINQQKITTVKQLYSMSGFEQGYDLLKQISTPSLYNVLDLDSRLKTDGELACIDYPVTVQSQDPNESEIIKTAKFSQLQNGNVQVSFKDSGTITTLQYKMVCQGGQCLIDDIIEPSGSFKKSIKQCLDKI